MMPSGSAQEPLLLIVSLGGVMVAGMPHRAAGGAEITMRSRTVTA